jgi:phage tail P2-like protein
MIDSGKSVENLLRTLPSVLAADPKAAALADMLARAYSRENDVTDLARIYSRIDELPESLLDILAYDFKVDWYDYDQSLDVKRRMIRDCVRIHKTLGTKAAVETALRAVFPQVEVAEWFEYGGNPYSFRLRIDTTGGDMSDEDKKKLMRQMAYYKNVRSHLDGITQVTLISSEIFFGTTSYGSLRQKFPLEIDGGAIDAYKYIGTTLLSNERTAFALSLNAPSTTEAYHGLSILTSERGVF